MAHIHIWLGRALLLVGVIQGGLGFLFAASFPKAIVDARLRILYGAVATVVYATYAAVVIIWPEIRSSRKAKRGRNEGVEMDVRGGNVMIVGQNYLPGREYGRV